MNVIDKYTEKASKAFTDMSNSLDEKHKVSQVTAQIDALDKEIEKEYRDLGRAIYLRKDVLDFKDCSAAEIYICNLKYKLDDREKLVAQRYILQHIKVCPVCKKVLPEGAIYCMHCGVKVGEEKPEIPSEELKSKLSEVYSSDNAYANAAEEKALGNEEK